MTQKNETMRTVLREIESRAATALANQPSDTEECGRHLNKALALIELRAHVARWGCEGYPPPYHAERIAHAASPAAATRNAGQPLNHQPPKGKPRR